MKGGVETIAGAERGRILATLLGRIDELTEAGVAAIRAEIPAYASQSEAPCVARRPLIPYD